MTMQHYQTKKGKGERFLVTAIRYVGPGAAIDADDWAACDSDGANGCLVAGMSFLEHQYAFPVDRGAGLPVNNGQWIVRYWDATVEIFDSAQFADLFEKMEAGQ